MSHFKSVAARMTPRQRRNGLLTGLCLLLLVMALHLLQSGAFLGSYQIKVLNLCAIYAILTLSMNLINGFTGQFSLGHAGFMAVGAYVTTLLFLPLSDKARVFYLKPIVPWLEAIEIPFWAALIAGGLAAALAGFLIGFPALRLRGDYLAIATLGFSEIIRVIFTNIQSVTNGSTGISRIPDTANLWWTFGAMILTVVFMLRLMRTSYGRAFKAIRDDEVAAEAMGISLFKHKMLSFIISSFFAGIGGGLMASVLGAINPLLFRFIITYDILLIVVLGGMGSVSGSIVAAFVITIAKEWLRWLDGGFGAGFLRVPPVAGLRMVIFSLLLMLVILFYRRGLFGSNEFSWNAAAAVIKNGAGYLAGLFKKRKGGRRG